MQEIEKVKIKKLKRSVIKEELVVLTGDFKEALVLNQLIYWSERVKDSDKFIKEELERERKFADGSTESKEDVEKNLRNGWIYKTSEEMLDEIMLTVSTRTIERIFTKLVDKEFITRRRNPKHKWDKTWQYRVNLNEIQTELMKLGYSLEGYSLIKPNSNQGFNGQTEGNDESNRQGVASNRQGVASNRQGVASNRQGVASNRQGDESNRHSVAAIPEITTESTSEITLKSTTEINSESSSSDEVKKEDDEKEDESQTLNSLFLDAILSKPVLKDIAQMLGLSHIGMQTIQEIVIGIENRYINVDYVNAREQLEHCINKQNFGEEIYNFSEYYLNGLETRCRNKNIALTDYVPEQYQQNNVSNPVPMDNWIKNLTVDFSS